MADFLEDNLTRKLSSGKMVLLDIGLIIPKNFDYSAFLTNFQVAKTEFPNYLSTYEAKLKEKDIGKYDYNRQDQVSNELKSGQFKSFFDALKILSIYAKESDDLGLNYVAALRKWNNQSNLTEILYYEAEKRRIYLESPLSIVAKIVNGKEFLVNGVMNRLSFPRKGTTDDTYLKYFDNKLNYDQTLSTLGIFCDEESKCQVAEINLEIMNKIEVKLESYFKPSLLWS